ncbi:hypothetical protein ACSBR1_019387 [Camellia fascicularis]
MERRRRKRRRRRRKKRMERRKRRRKTEWGICIHTGDQCCTQWCPCTTYVTGKRALSEGKTTVVEGKQQCSPPHGCGRERQLMRVF